MKKVLYIFVGILALGALWFAYYTISPLFRSVKIDETVPPMSDAEKVQSEQQVVSASVIGTTGHPASGTVRVIETDGKNYIRYENFKTINGPDLYVYLAKDLDAKDFVSLGTLRATEGNVNYEIPESVNLADYQYVMTWCRQFSALFNYADISKILK